MRIISGKYKGKKIDGFDIVGTRPTMDRVKESLFAMIQNDLKESICLDLFAGSGNLGIEALSNGSSWCFFVDSNKVSINILNKNLNGIKEKTIIHIDYKKALNDFALKKQKFDIIFLDPPYDLNLINPSLELIKKLNLLNEDGIIVCEYEKEQLNDNLFNVYKEKKYGSKMIKIYKNY